MTFCYFVLGWQCSLLETVDAIPESTGLRTILRDREPKVSTSFTCRPGSGPDGMTGTFMAAIPVKPSSGEPAGQEFSPMEFDESCRRDEESGDFVSATQRWRPVKNANDETTHFIGWNLAAIPGPEDLRRLNMVEGHAVTLNDGRDWIVPVVGPYRSRLPVSFKMNAKGEAEFATRKDFRRIMAMSEDLQKRTDGATTVLKVEFWKYAVELLTINYRIGFNEAGADVLDLFSNENYIDVYRVSIGERDFEIDDEVKKKQGGVASDT